MILFERVIYIKDILIYKSEGVKDCVKWMIKKIKEEKRLLESEKEDYRYFGWFDDCGDFYRSKVEEREFRISVLIETKISLEKYAKKLKHESDEIR